jgi:hypothetical protein
LKRRRKSLSFSKKMPWWLPDKRYTTKKLLKDPWLSEDESKGSKYIS